MKTKIDIPQEWVVKGAEALRGVQESWGGDPVPFSESRMRARAVLAAVLPDTWPCDNYLRPITCLTAPSAVGARCNFCREQSIAATPLP